MKGKVAIVTASSTGIGKAIARRIAQEGCKVVISSRNQKNVDQAVSQLKKDGHDVIGIVCHVGKAQDRTNLINAALQKWGRLDYVVGNAAVSTHVGPSLQATEKQITKMWQINYLATFFLIQEAVPHLKKQQNSSIAIISSYAAYEFSDVIGHYSITKTALLGLGKVLSKQLLSDNIRVNVVAPGLIKTDFSGLLWKENQNKSAKYMGVKRLGQPRQIANTVKFLLSDEASYITGESILVAGKPIARL